MSQLSPNSDRKIDRETSDFAVKPPGLADPAGHTRPRHLRLRRWGLALADSLGVLAGILVAAEVGRLRPENLIWTLGIIPIWIFVAKLYNLYDRDDRRIQHLTLDEMPSLMAAAAITVVIAKGLTLLASAPTFASSGLIIICGTAAVVALFLRTLVRHLYRRKTAPQRTIVLGGGAKAVLVASRLNQENCGHVEVCGFVAASPNGTGGSPAQLGFDYFGSVEDLPRILEANDVSRVVIADDDIAPPIISSIIGICDATNVAVAMVPANQAVLGPDTELNRIAGVPMLDFHFSVPPRSTMWIKRALDFTVSAVLLTIISPILVISAILIKLDSRGPVLFRQTRAGKNGKPFTMIKLRTMDANAEEQLDDLIDLDALDQPAFKIPDDPRITRIGRWLRRSSLDEVPQFFNVLRGDMSLVGPRPEEKAVVALYDDRQRQRLQVKPGLTGPMQVAGRGGLSFEERLALERDYLDNLTIAGDLAILLRTPHAVIRGDGAF